MVSVKQIRNFAMEVAASVASQLLPLGGSTGQVLVKNDDEVVWQDFASATQDDIKELEAQNWFL